MKLNDKEKAMICHALMEAEISQVDFINQFVRLLKKHKGAPREKINNAKKVLKYLVENLTLQLKVSKYLSTSVPKEVLKQIKSELKEYQELLDYLNSHE